MARARYLIAFFSCLVATVLVADEHVLLLLPFGSLYSFANDDGTIWQPRTLLTNDSTQSAAYTYVFECYGIPPCSTTTPIPPGSTTQLWVGQSAGAVVSVSHADPQLRAVTYLTEAISSSVVSVPGVFENEFLTRPAEFTSLQMSEHLRVRVYGLPYLGQYVTLRIFADESRVELAHFVLPLKYIPGPPNRPAFAEIPDLASALPDMDGLSQIRLVIEPGPHPFWACIFSVNPTTRTARLLKPELSITRDRPEVFPGLRRQGW